jgi:phage antirepressor YoqD-like protein
VISFLAGAAGIPGSTPWIKRGQTQQSKLPQATARTFKLFWKQFRSQNGSRTIGPLVKAEMHQANRNDEEDRAEIQNQQRLLPQQRATDISKQESKRQFKTACTTSRPLLLNKEPTQ